jgi:hypothetical protein
MCLLTKMQFALEFRNEKVISGACCNWMAQPAIRTLNGRSATICPGKAGFRNGITIQQLIYDMQEGVFHAFNKGCV